MGLEEILMGLRAELEALERELKYELPRKIQAARELGDLRESGEYEAIKDRQGFVQARITYLKQRIAALSSINPNTIPKDRIGFGSTLRDLDNGEVKVYKLVAPEEVDASRGFISMASPVGRSLMGRREGDEVVIQTPGGRKRYEVIKVVTVHEHERKADG
ncbi:MAG: GreA/GreB family elongation factor [Candidatus Methylomirabilales bacterium]